MTALEQRQIKGITVKNIVLTVLSTASIVTSVVTTYFGLKSEIQSIKSSGETEVRINNIRIKILEDQTALLQKEINDIQLAGKASHGAPERAKTTDPAMLSAIEK
ncbi:hypothetical protein [Mucilaginibacter xinganensis]|uniref:Uncharacterized protein n=1 Tax=Mucilaginibacter xinganensis TaxID=1234841 RepID=A0A223NTF8_9SPHI|nr:hypothetical protein [Mucilaginibacter xinganensis]ASU33137.1 hypothetical protein MuYL_1239 [Mucilaginibacter xinganensis]